MKHIIFVMPTLRMGGAERALVSLLKTLDPKRVKVDLFLFERGGVLEKEVPSWVKIIQSDPIVRDMTLELRNYLGELLRHRKLSAAITRLKITAMARRRKNYFSWGAIEKYIPSVPGHYDVAVGFLEGFTDFFVVDKVNADRKIGWIHTDMSGKIFNKQEMAYYRKLDMLATISEKCRTAFITRSEYPGERMRVIENIVLPQEILHKADETVDEMWDSSKVHIVSVGRLEYLKGMDIAAKTALILKENGCDFVWHIYGRGLMREEISQYVKQNNLSDCFILEGQRPNPYPYMKKADIIVQPSRREGKSLVLDEAKILGKAIVVTNYPSVTDQITDRKTGIIVDTTPQAIAEGVELLVTDKRLKSNLEDNCRRAPNRSRLVVDQFYKLTDI
ncbi:glycosyltransferase [Mediterraneibacter catenae]|uniref:Glycosyltransferase n=1 Tax=Mediterraneibacter catenae TaxID=2594882 RepID=A0A5M9HWP2_9FIRM|nr:glycosyltransferase [Mediterraneibacter catenae]KAA8501158.1 glycosyltransferase [Mediterraneibacter catenae]